MTNHSFVIPAYKNSPYLESCIVSLLNQTIRSEVIITTSTPSDFIKSIAEKYNLPYFINPNVNSGIANDWNFALSKASSNLVTIAHQDDVYDSHFSKMAVEKFMKYSDMLICFTDYEDLFTKEVRRNSAFQLIKKTLLLPILFQKNSRSYFVKKSLLAFGNPITCPSVTFNLNMIKGFCFDTDYRFVVDWKGWLELSRLKGRFIYINKVLLKHRIHENSATSAEMKSGARSIEEKELFVSIWGNFIGGFIAFIYQLSHLHNKPGN